MFARLGFSVAAHLDPDILVIDEVLSVGDFVFQRKSLQKMRSIATGGATVVFVSHNLKAVSDLCARAILIDDGQIVEDGPTPDVIQTYLARERSKLQEERARGRADPVGGAAQRQRQRRAIHSPARRRGST